MATENIGAIAISITGDPTQFYAALSQTQAQANRAGAAIASGLTGAMAPALQGATGLVDQFGRAIQSTAAPIQNTAKATTDLSAAADGLIGSLGGVAEATERVATANRHAVSEIQATSGALRTLDGNGGIRAAERFIAGTLGLGPVMQAIFAPIGAIALTEVLVKMGEAVYKAGENFLFMKDAELEAMKIGTQLAHEAESAFAKINEIQAAALDKQGKHIEAAQLRQQGLLNQPVKLPDVLNNKEIKDALDTHANQAQWRELKNLLTEVIPADIPKRIDAINAAMGRLQSIMDSVSAHGGPGGLDVLNTHYFNQAKVGVELYAQALEFLKVKQSEAAAEIGRTGKEGVDKQAQQAGEQQARTIEAQIQASKELLALRKETAESVIRQQKDQRDAGIESSADPHAEVRYVALANSEVQAAKARETQLTALVADETTKRIALIHGEYAAKAEGQDAPTRARLAIDEEKDVQAAQDESAANYVKLHLQTEEAATHAARTIATENHKALEQIKDESRKAFDEMAAGFRRFDEERDKVITKDLTGKSRVIEIQDRAEGRTSELAIQHEKLESERQYGLQVGHTAQQQIAHARELAEIEQRARQAKINGLQAEANAISADSNDPAQLEKRAQIEGQIAELKQQSANADYQAATKVLELEKQRTLQYQLRSAVFNAGAQVPGAIGNALARGITGGGQHENIGKEVSDALRNVGQQLLGQVFAAAIHQLISTILANTIAQTALHVIFGTSVGVQAANTAAQTANATASTALAAANIGLVASNIALTAMIDALIVSLAVNSATNLFGFADGGVPPIGVPSMVGERGPELFIPHQSGTIIPNHMLKGYADGAGLSFLNPNSSNGGGFSGDMHFHAHGITEPQRFTDHVMRTLPTALRSKSSVFSPANK